MKTQLKWLVLIFFVVGFFFFSSNCFAGTVEIGASANLRKSTIDKNNFQDSTSYTGSISYYFWEMSALEISYTEGTALLSVKPVDDTKIITTSSFRLIGVDLVISLASSQSFLQPYLKVGAAHIEKKIVRQPEGMDASEIEAPKGIVPSAGLGFKLILSKNFSIKIGADAWTSPLGEKNPTIDYAGRAGISWLF